MSGKPSAEGISKASGQYFLNCAADLPIRGCLGKKANKHKGLAGCLPERCLRLAPLYETFCQLSLAVTLTLATVMRRADAVCCLM